MKALILLITISLSGFGASAKDAQFFRFWQGYKLSHLSQQDFQALLPEFMNLTVDVYGGRGLVNYHVAIPPNDKPEVVPDEFALVSFDSEASYRKVRSTPEGIAYGQGLFFDGWTSRC